MAGSTYTYSPEERARSDGKRWCKECQKFTTLPHDLLTCLFVYFQGLKKRNAFNEAHNLNASQLEKFRL